jgi:hypothetical protein
MQTLACEQALYATSRRGFAILTWVSFYSRSACRANQFVVQLVISAWKLVKRLSVLFCRYSETKAQIPRKLSNIYVTYHSTRRVENFYCEIVNQMHANQASKLVLAHFVSICEIRLNALAASMALLSSVMNRFNFNRNSATSRIGKRIPGRR